MLAVVIIGLVTLALTIAATVTISVEPESGTLTGKASVITDGSASDGKAIRFGAAPSAQCASGGNYLWAHLAACGWPDASNTGYNASQCSGGALTNVGSSMSTVITISTSNSTYSCRNVTGCLYVTGTNVTISNVKITCDSGKKGVDVDIAGPEGHGGIYVEDGASATITNAEVDAHKGTHACVWHQGKSLSVANLNCYNADDGIFSWPDTGYSQTTGDNFTIKDSYFHDFTGTTSNGHIDGYQTEGAGNGLIDHNTFSMTSDNTNNYTDSSIAIWNSLRSSHDITVQNNLLTGGGFTVYAEDYSPSEANNSGGYTVTNIIFTNNSFSTILKPSSQCVGFGSGWDGAVWFRVGQSDAWHRTGNKVLETGENIDNGNPHLSSGAQCN